MRAGEGHRFGGTDYSTHGINAYTKHRHGPDGAKFLDKPLKSLLRKIKGRTADVGAGAGPWSIYAARHGASFVLAVDYQAGMTQQAQSVARNTGFSENKIFVAQADAAELPAVDGSFSTALSINVGCNLPETKTVESEIVDSRRVGFNPHFTEMARVLNDGGKAIITAPTSFGEVFTNGKRPKEEVLNTINDKLEAIGESHDAHVIREQLNTLDDVYRATFAFREDRLVLITDEKELKSGEEIWRKLPGLTVPNYYHHEAEYQDAAEAAGLQLVTKQTKTFRNNFTRWAYNLTAGSNRKLGPEYVKDAGS